MYPGKLDLGYGVLCGFRVGFGDYIMSPRPSNHHRSFSVRLPLDLFNRLCEAAKQEHCDVHDLIVRRLNEPRGICEINSGPSVDSPGPEVHHDNRHVKRRIHAGTHAEPAIQIESSPTTSGGLLQPTVHSDAPPPFELPSDLPPVGESREVLSKEDIYVMKARKEMAYKGAEIINSLIEVNHQLTHEEFYALPFHEQMKAVKDGRF